jgi:hypothetical protein
MDLFGASAAKSIFACSFRTVPTTRWPAVSASCANARPKPLLTPVISRVLVDTIEVTSLEQ